VWDAGRSETKPLVADPSGEAGSQPEAQDKSRSWSFARLSTPVKAALVGIPVALVAIFVAAWLVKSIDIPLVGSSGSSTPRAADGGPSLTDLENESTRRCIALWNGRLNQADRETVANLDYSTEDAPLYYVSVGPSATFPDKCLFTVASPTTNRAFQFVEGAEGSNIAGFGIFGLPVFEGSPSELDASVTNWNATADGDGNVTLTNND
jgi:hypothetical protein